jgi:DNA-directed RNA polymerase specialized sigma24 family protein
MKTPSKHDLDFHIYDMGYYEALERFGLTEEKAEEILFGLPEKAPQRPGRYVEKEEKDPPIVWSEDIKELRRVAAKYYQVLYQEASAGINQKINKRALSNYDIFSMGMERVLRSNGDFEYIDDEQALAYIRTRIKRTIAADERQERRYMVFVRYRDDLLSNSHSIETDLSEYLDEIPDAIDRIIIAMVIQGYTQAEIALTVNRSQATVSNRIRVYRETIKNSSL